MVELPKKIAEEINTEMQPVLTPVYRADFNMLIDAVAELQDIVKQVTADNEKHKIDNLQRLKSLECKEKDQRAYTINELREKYKEWKVHHAPLANPSNSTSDIYIRGDFISWLEQQS